MDDSNDSTTLFLLAIATSTLFYLYRHHRQPTATAAATTDQTQTEQTEQNDGDGYGHGSVREAAPNGYEELCILRRKVPDDDRFLSAQNGCTCFERGPPDDGEVERERRVLYIPTGENGTHKLTAKALSNLIIASVDNTHYNKEDERGKGSLPTVKVFSGQLAGLFFEHVLNTASETKGKAIFVPLEAIARYPDEWCGIERRDYYVLNPDVMENEATEESLDRWRVNMRILFFALGLLHLYVWNHYNGIIGLLVPGGAIAGCILLWKQKFELRNGQKLNDKLIDEAFFVYDFLSSPIAWIKMTILFFGYLYMFGYEVVVLHVFTSGLGFFSGFLIRMIFRWRWGLPVMIPTSVFDTRLARVCETLAPQGGTFWGEQPRACVEIFGNFEWHYIQAVEKVLIFVLLFAVAVSVIQSLIIDKIFKNTRSAWPQAFIYSVLALSTYQLYINTPLDILPGWGDDFHDGGQQQFAADYNKALAEEKIRSTMGSNNLNMWRL